MQGKRNENRRSVMSTYHGIFIKTLNIFFLNAGKTENLQKF